MWVSSTFQSQHHHVVLILHDLDARVLLLVADLGDEAWSVDQAGGSGWRYVVVPRTGSQQADVLSVYTELRFMDLQLGWTVDIIPGDDE